MNFLLHDFEVLHDHREASEVKICICVVTNICLRFNYD